MSRMLEKQIGYALAISGLAWAVYHLFHRLAFDAYMRLGPMQLVLLGLIVFLHGKYRDSKPIVSQQH